MSVYDYMPKKNYQRSGSLMIILIAAAAAFMTIPAIFQNMQFKWIFQTSAVLCLAAMILVFSRYVTKTMLYEIVEDDEGGLDFAVTEITGRGRNRVTVCRFSLGNIEQAELFYTDTPDGKANKKKFTKEIKKEGRQTFNYCPDPLSNPVCMLCVCEGGEKLLIKITPDAKIIEYIQAAGI